MKILNFGSLNIDKVYSVDDFVVPGETISSLDFTQNLGGKGLNQSIAACRAGANLIHVGTVGFDGQDMIDALVKEGADTKWVLKAESESGHAIIQVSRQGENAIIVHKGANHLLDKKRIDVIFSSLKEKHAVLIQNEVSNLDYIVRRAYEEGHYVVINPSPITPDLLDLDLNCLHLVIVNEIEAKMIFKEESIEAVIEKVSKRYPHLEVVITLGSKGSIYVHRDKIVKQKAFLHEVVDTTAAGDTFAGYLLANKVMGESIEVCLTRASQASGLAVTRLGAVPSIPYKEELEIEA